ncbi:MAG: phenylalanine--tRNA ligase subunit beta [bacterium]|nr:phenylalanine--tRNA ligase subunit beta [bacterium]
MKMMISYNWLSDYIKINDDLNEVAEKITRAGVNVERVIVTADTLLVVGLVEKVEKHPFSDHLHVCQVHIGKEVLQIVCGAPNIAENQKVIVALIGCKLPGGEITKSTIRKVDSYGMICSLEEVGLEDIGNSENGIFVLPDSARIGENPITELGLDDKIFILDLNPNRNDCLSHIGFAYEVGAVLNKNVKLPDTTYTEVDKNINDYINISIKTDNCFMYQAKMVDNVVVGESPDFIKQRLNVAGMRSINNVVDISNYIMLEYGQPLHFFDYDKVGKHLIVRMADNGEDIITLDNVKQRLDDEDIVIANKTSPICLAGVMGGINSEIDENTKTILIESAIFNPMNVRKTSIKLENRSEASLRYEKGLNYEYCSIALDRACHLLEKYASATVYTDKYVYDKVDKTPKVVVVTKNKINDVLGMDLTTDDILLSLNKLGFPVEVDEDEFTVVIPNRRMDVAIKEDIIEEVGRLYGYDKIVATVPSLPTTNGKYTAKTLLRKEISKILRLLGLNEVRTYTLISLEDSNKYIVGNKTKLFLNKPMSLDKSVVRNSLLSSLVNVFDYNVARNIKDILIYEIANVYDGEYKEETKLSIGMMGSYFGNGWKEDKQVDFYIMKGIIENLLDYLGFKGRYSFYKSDCICQEMHPNISCEVLIDNEMVGILGKIHPSVSSLPIYLGEISIDKIYNKKLSKIKYKDINKYPSSVKDMAFIVDNTVTVGEVIKFIKSLDIKELTDVVLFDVYEGDNIEKGKKSLAFSFTFESYDKTLREDDISYLIGDVVKELENKYNAILRDS